MIIGMSLPIEVRYGSRPGARAVLDAVIVTTLTSVFNVANPSPGKCFIVGRTPFDSSPEANASARVAVVDASNEKVRPSLYMKELVEPGTSATGARSMSTPRSWSATPVLAPCERATEALPDLPISGGEIVGGAHGIRLIGPPS